MKNFSNISEMSVLCLEDESIDFTVVDVDIDRANLTIKQYILDGGAPYRYHVVPHASVAIGDMRMISEKREYLTNITDADTLVLPINMPVVSMTGDNIGQIIDFSFEEVTGLLSELYIDSGNDEISVSAKDITFFTSVAVLNTTIRTDSDNVSIPEITAALPHTEEYEPAATTELLDGQHIDDDVSILNIEESNEIEEAPAFVSPAELADSFTVAEAPYKERSALEQESISFLLGKVINHDIKSDDGKLVLKAGTVLTEDIIDEAEAHDAILTLTLSV